MFLFPRSSRWLVVLHWSEDEATQDPAATNKARAAGDRGALMWRHHHTTPRTEDQGGPQTRAHEW